MKVGCPATWKPTEPPSNTARALIGIIKISSIILACVLVAGLILYGVFKNHGEEQRAKTFLGLLDAHNYPAAYAMWGCTDSHPCPEYPFAKFQDDWGPKSGHANEAVAHIGLSQSCGTRRVDPAGL